MLESKFILKKTAVHIFKFLLILLLFQSCKIYQDPISIQEAATNNEEGYLKITMLNGDEYVFESIANIEGEYYGFYYEDDEKLKTLLQKDNIKEVQRQNKKASKGNNFVGISIGVLSAVVGVLMFQ